LTQTSANGGFNARLILEYIKGKIKENNEVDISRLSFVLMVNLNA